MPVKSNTSVFIPIPRFKAPSNTVNCTKRMFIKVSAGRLIALQASWTQVPNALAPASSSLQTVLRPLRSIRPSQGLHGLASRRDRPKTPVHRSLKHRRRRRHLRRDRPDLLFYRPLPGVVSAAPARSCRRRSTHGQW